MDSQVEPYYITWLSNELLRRKAKNRYYSLRGYAKSLGVDPSALSRILSRKQEISLSTCLKIVQKLDMTGPDRELFLSSVADEHKLRATRFLKRAADPKLSLKKPGSPAPTAGSVASEFGVETVSDKVSSIAELEDQSAGIRNHRALMERILAMALPSLADCALIDTSGSYIQPDSFLLMHRDPTQEQAFRLHHSHYPEVARAALVRFFHRDAMVVPSIPESFKRRICCGNLGALRSLKQLAFTSAMSVPVASRGNAYGVLVFLRADPERAFEETDLKPANDLAQLAALAFDQVRLYQRACRAAFESNLGSNVVATSPDEDTSDPFSFPNALEASPFGIKSTAERAS